MNHRHQEHHTVVAARNTLSPGNVLRMPEYPTIMGEGESALVTEGGYA